MLSQQTPEGILVSILNGLKKPTCIESFVSMIAYIGETGCSNKTSMTDSSILNKSAIDEHGINILLKDKGVLVRKYSHINYIMLDMIVIELCCDKMFTA